MPHPIDPILDAGTTVQSINQARFFPEDSPKMHKYGAYYCSFNQSPE
jgi:hypothetical protein